MKRRAAGSYRQHEAAIRAYVAARLTNREIGEMLDASEGSVRRWRILLGIHGRGLYRARELGAENLHGGGLRIADEIVELDEIDTAEEIRALISAAKLKGKRKRVILLRYGLDGADEPMTLAAIGRELGVSIWRVWQLESSALWSLRRTAERRERKLERKPKNNP